MPATKREREEAEPSKKAKKIKFSDAEPKLSSKLVPEEIDFPRGGGSTFTPLEYKTIRAEAIKEANAELVLEDSQVSKKNKWKRKTGQVDANNSKKRKGVSEAKKKEDTIRVEHLNYKRLVEGMKVFGQIIAIQPLALIVSLPCQLVGHIPITQISTQLTKQLEALDEEAEQEVDGDDEETLRKVPELFEMFRTGQYVRTVVTAVRPAGTTAPGVIGLRRKLDETERSCQRVELSLIPGQVNTGLSKQDLSAGFVLPAAVESVEDHGYILDLGVSSVSGFLSFKDAQKGQFSNKLTAGHVLDVCISQISENGRTCTVVVDRKTIGSSSLSQTTSVTSVLPGTLVQALVTAVLPSGLNVQLLGFFEGTIDLFHLPPGDISKCYKLGQKIKARVLWDIVTSDPRKFALSLLHHTLNLDVVRIIENKQALQDAYPVGTTLEAVKVVRVETERGLVVELQNGVLGYVHIRHVSDDHVPSLSTNSGKWKLETIHPARVIGFQALDGILQLSLQESVLAQKFLQVADVEVGERLKATVKKLTSSALFVSISGNVDGVIWPNHYADINLKQPQKRFKEGAAVKCRVLVVDPERKRIALTAKRTLVESELPTLAFPEDAHIGTVTHAVVFKVLEKALLVEFYNNLRAQVPLQEVSETPLANLAEAFPVGKPVKVRITRVDPDSRRIVASIRQAFAKAEVPDVHGVQVGETVTGPVQAIHTDQIVVKLQPSGVTALLSINNLANSRETTAAQLRTALAIGEQLDDLIVLSQNPEKGLVIISTRPKSKSKPSALPGNQGVSVKTVEIGQILSGRVTGYGRGGSSLYITSTVRGSLHPTDSCDDYSTGMPFPNVDSIVEGMVVGFDKSRRHITMSMRPSRLHPAEKLVQRDREISSVEDLKVGDTVRGFVKSIVEHGLFVSLGRTVDARVQIRELFDEYVKDWKPRFKVSQLVEGKIARVDVTAKQVEMTLRSGPAGKRIMTLSDFHEGQKVDAIIKKKENYGVFLEINDTKISGLCHKSEISDNLKADVDQALLGFREGDPVKAVILTLNLEKRRISFGLKQSYFHNEDFEMHDAEASLHEDSAAIAEEAHSAEDSDSDDDPEVVQMVTEPVQNEQQPLPQVPPLPETAPAFQLQGGFSWSDTHQNEPELLSESASESESDTLSGPGKKSKNKKKKKGIEYDLTGDMHTRQPESTGDFERLLLGSPNSSYLWIQYMSFQLQLSEIEKARDIGKRALRTINFREEQEKLNVWIALLNLENKFGTDESLEATFKDAARHNDSKTIHLRLASIFEETERHDHATELYQRTCKKFGKSSKVWTLFGEHYLKCGDLEAARQLLSRSLQSLEKRKHLKTISKFAQLEYKFGDAERGRTIFEGMTASHPKRWDIWSIYIDMEATKQNIQGIRNIFHRIIALKMTSYKAKSFFKKWLMLENQLGDEDGANTVKEKAVEWTRRASAGVT